MAYRAFYALPPENFTTSTGQPTNAVYGFSSMLINLIKDRAPTHIAVAFDVSRKSFRTDLFPEYKAGRAKTPEEFKGQVEVIKEVLKALSITTIEREGYEADDLIATLATHAETEGFSTDIVTGDRDSFALINDRTTVLYPRKGVSDLAQMTPGAVTEKYGLTPNQYPDFAALRGDPSDNLPGIPGVGEKTAQKWLTAYGSLSELVVHADEIGGKVGQSLRDHLTQVELNRRITELVRDVPLELRLDQLETSTFNMSEVDQLFDTLQFTALRPRVAALPGAQAAHNHGEKVLEADSPAGSETHNLDWEKIDVLSVALEAVDRDGGDIAVVVQGEFARGSGAITSIAIRDSSVVRVVCDLDSRGSREFLDWLATYPGQITVHDGKGILWACCAAGIDLPVFAMDTALAAYLVDPGLRSYDLADLSQRFAGVVLEESDSQLSLLDDAHVETLGQHANALWQLGRILVDRLREVEAMSLLVDIELPTQAALAHMEHAGIAVDRSALVELSEQFSTKIQAARTQSMEYVGREFNLGSPKQLQEVLFVDRGLPKTRKIKTGFTTDAEALQALFEKTQDPLLEQILIWREETKLKQTVETLLPLVDQHSRIHTTFKQTVAATGRLSSADPNLQNIPVRTQAGRHIRAAFVVGRDFECLLTADYSQIELRIMAHLSQDTNLIEAFKSGEDLHDTVARKVFDVTEVTPDLRRQIKAMSYGLAYGLSPYGLAAQLGISTEDARIMMDDYFRRFGGIRDYLANVVEEARTRLYTETMFGRRRKLPDLRSENRQRREIAERMALNAPIQGSAADIVKIAMLGVANALSSEGLSSRLLLQVHDELVLEVAPGECDHVTNLVQREMQGAVHLDVPLDINIGTGPNWDAAAH